MSAPRQAVSLSHVTGAQSRFFDLSMTIHTSSILHVCQSYASFIVLVLFVESLPGVVMKVVDQEPNTKVWLLTDSESQVNIALTLNRSVAKHISQGHVKAWTRNS